MWRFCASLAVGSSCIWHAVFLQRALWAHLHSAPFFPCENKVCDCTGCKDERDCCNNDASVVFPCWKLAKRGACAFCNLAACIYGLGVFALRMERRGGKQCGGKLCCPLLLLRALRFFFKLQKI